MVSDEKKKPVQGPAGRGGEGLQGLDLSFNEVHSMLAFEYDTGNFVGFSSCMALSYVYSTNSSIPTLAVPKSAAME